MNKIRSVFAATGSYIPESVIPNSNFLEQQFFEKTGERIERDNATIIEKFKDISGISERRYAAIDQTASDMGYIAAAKAFSSSGMDPETLDYIIVAHNFGDIAFGTNRCDTVPTLASRIKQRLGIQNPDCVAFDLPFGCPGWVQGIIHADYFIRSGDAKRILVVGTETLSRVFDRYDRDSMLYSDGAGACILKANTSGAAGILAHKTQTYAFEHSSLLAMQNSYNNEHDQCDIFLKMNGRKLYEFALTNVPLVVKAALDKAGVHLSGIKKVLIHQANDKMDAAIVDRLFKLYGMENTDPDIMPMTISWLGNSSVATVPTLLDLILKGKIENQSLNEGDKVVIASVGAGMNINAVVYQF